MEQAPALLANTDLLIYEIALRVGYENANYFSTLYRQTTGASPQDVRRLRTTSGLR
mgnify:FL=1